MTARRPKLSRLQLDTAVALFCAQIAETLHRKPLILDATILALVSALCAACGHHPEPLAFHVTDTGIYYSVRQVAALFGYSERWFRLHRRNLERRGFPKPVRECKTARKRYLKSAVNKWLAKH